MKNSKRFLSLLILLSTVAMFSLVTVTASELSTPQKYMPDNSIEIEEKYKKTSTNKVIFNANGGKIGSKKTIAINIKKGSKIKKLPSTPKRTGYSFKGWYSKKTGGTKISTNTKPNKDVTYFAQWTKTTAKSKLVGHWKFENYRDLNPIPLSDRIWLLSKNYYYDYYFFRDGSFKFFYEDYIYNPAGFPKDRKIHTMTEGKYKVENNKIYFTNILYERGQPLESRYKDTVFEYKFGKDYNGEYLLMPAFRYDVPSVDISWGVKFRKIK